MHYYFTLQYRRFSRKMNELGISAIIAIVLGAILFVLGSAYLFYKTEYASWIYAFFAISALFSLGERRRIEPLRLAFSQTLYRKVRMVENAVCVLPFAIYLMYETEWLLVGALLLAAPALAMIGTKRNLPFTIPTPFSRFPFEYIVGFRRYLPLVMSVLFVLYKAVEVSNYYLGLFAVGVLSFMGIGFYSVLEREYFIWIHASSSHDFLFRKMRWAVICNAILVLPALVVMLVSFQDQYLLTFGIFALGSVYVCSMILAKYSTYPHEMSLPQGIIYGLSFAFPPLLLILIPRFYFLSKNRLSGILS